MLRIFRPGVFDLLHVGHINCIKDASKQGDYLIVGVHDDRDVFVEKGKMPIIPLEQRMLIINEIKGVNEVISYRTTNIIKVLQKFKINVLAVNEEYGKKTYKNYKEQLKVIEFCKKNKIRIHKTKHTKHISSTQIKKNIEFWNNIDIKKNSNATMLTSFKKNSKLQESQTKYEVNIFKKFINKKMTVLDLGCGNGRLSLPISKYCKEIVCVDSSKTLIDDFSKKIKNKNIKLHIEDALSFVKKNKKKYDAIIMSGLLQNFDDLEFFNFVKNINKISKKNCMLLIRVSVAKKERINVINQFSEALNALYTAYYRTTQEITNSFKNFKVIENKDLYSNHKDTKTIFLAFKSI